MIITIKGADFSLANIGTLSTYIISKSIGSGASFDIPNFVDKNSSVNWTITLDEGYTFGTYSVTMGGEVITPTVVDNVMTISIAEVTGNVRIVVATVNENTGEEDEPDEPTMYTLTINPNPSDAIVKLTANGYSQVGNSITVPNGTIVSYIVSAFGYTTQSSSVVVTSTQEIVITLIEEEMDESKITWYIDNSGQEGKNFSYLRNPGAALRINPERLRGVPINVIKFVPCGEAGPFCMSVWTPGTQPTDEQDYYIDIPASDIATSGDGEPKTYILDETIYLNENEYLVMNSIKGEGTRKAGFWVYASDQNDYSVCTVKVADWSSQDEGWGLPFSIGYYGDEQPENPSTPTKYTLTINPTPNNATVKINGVVMNSIEVTAGTNVSWEVSADGYVTKSGNHTVTKTETITISLELVSGGNTGDGEIDESAIVWYVDNSGQKSKTFNYTINFPGAAVIAEDKAEALRNVPINVIKFMPSVSGGKFALAKLTPGTEPSASDIYYIDIPNEDVYTTSPSNDAEARTYILNTPITLNENEYLVMNYLHANERTTGFWVNAGAQAEYKVGTYDRTNYTLKNESWGLPFSIGYLA